MTVPRGTTNAQGKETSFGCVLRVATQSAYVSTSLRRNHGNVLFCGLRGSHLDRPERTHLAKIPSTVDQGGGLRFLYHLCGTAGLDCFFMDFSNVLGDSHQTMGFNTHQI